MTRRATLRKRDKLTEATLTSFQHGLLRVEWFPIQTDALGGNSQLNHNRLALPSLLS